MPPEPAQVYSTYHRHGNWVWITCRARNSHGVLGNCWVVAGSALRWLTDNNEQRAGAVVQRRSSKLAGLCTSRRRSSQRPPTEVARHNRRRHVYWRSSFSHLRSCARRCHLGNSSLKRIQNPFECPSGSKKAVQGQEALACFPGQVTDKGKPGVQAAKAPLLRAYLAGLA